MHTHTSTRAQTCAHAHTHKRKHVRTHHHAYHVTSSYILYAHTQDQLQQALCHTFYVTSSCIPCHIIIHTIRAHTRSTSTSPLSYILCHIIMHTMSHHHTHYTRTHKINFNKPFVILTSQPKAKVQAVVDTVCLCL